ncbi:MAG: ParA family protein [Lachnospiraceae bacterium]|nr:ParA family protein [Lachnospiraceae bacterium]
MNNKCIKIALINQKGGTGKSNSTLHIAGWLVKDYKKKVLIVDGDPQSNISETLLQENAFLYEKTHSGNYFENIPTIVDALNGTCDVNDAIYKALIKIRDRYDGKWRGIDVLPTTEALSAVKFDDDFEIRDIFKSIRRTKKRAYNYDFILCDCPPTLSDLTINILAACDYVLVPASPDMDSLKGFSKLLDTINGLQNERIQHGYSEKLDILGVYMTIIKPSESFDKVAYQKGQKNIGDKFFDIAIRRDTTAKQSYSLGVPLCWYKQTSSAAKDYRLLTKSILSRLNMLPEEEQEELESGVKEFVEKYGLED